MGSGNSGAKKFYVADEVAPLRAVGLFGPPGIESYLAQFWPEEESLFLRKFNVREAQSEFDGLAAILEGMGIEVVNLRAAFAQIQNGRPMSAEKLVKALSEKVPEADKNTIEELMHRDALSYGERNAAALNTALSYKPAIPMGNIHFARDQSNVFLDTCIIGNMAYPVRKAETSVVHKALKSLGYGSFLHLKDGAFEGGDGMIINGKAYIGAGIRTTPDAVHKIREHLEMPTFMVENPPSGSWREDMQRIHLDTYFMPLSESKVIGCMEILQSCTIHDLQSGAERNFLDYLGEHFEVLDIPRKEQKNFAANMLVVEPGTVIVPSDYNYHTNAVLEEHGVKTINTGLKQLTGGGGATHCMVLQLEKHED